MWLDEGSRFNSAFLQTQVRRSGGKVEKGFAILLNLLPGRDEICYASNILFVIGTTSSVVRQFLPNKLMCAKRRDKEEL
jgi:hypothetical protein